MLNEGATAPVVARTHEAATRHPLVRKLAGMAPLSEVDKTALVALSAFVRAVPPRQDLLQEGEAAETAYLVLQGFAGCYKLLPDGTRQITDLLVPGDTTDLNALRLGGTMDHAVATLSACAVAAIPRVALLEVLDNHAGVARALSRCAMLEASVLRERLVSIGRRRAEQRMSHLFCEVLARLGAVGLADEDGCEWPLTQGELGDVLSLSNVHVNRVLQHLRAAGLIVLQDKRLTVPDVVRLRAFAGFTPNYLHLCVPERNTQDHDGANIPPHPRG